MCAAVAFAGTLAAPTPVVNAGGVVNATSYAYAGLPSGGIAQGSLFAIFGSNLGPTRFVQPTALPIPTTLGNVSVKVTSGTTTAQAPLFLASSGQITALLPSTIAVGTASLTVTTSAGTSAAQSFQVVAGSFGTFALNSGGSGAAVITNPSFTPFALTKARRSLPAGKRARSRRSARPGIAGYGRERMWCERGGSNSHALAGAGT